MGDILDLESIINYFKKGDSANFIAEVFWEELQFLLSKKMTDSIIVQNHGMNSRVKSKDVLNVEINYHPVGNTLKEFIILHLSRNSVYHQLPESLFHKLVISSPSMSNKEVVEAIRYNRKIEKRNIDFLRFFDTSLFCEKSTIVKRHLSFLFDDKSIHNFSCLANKLLHFNKDISSHKRLYCLFLKLCQVEDIKENFDEIEKLIHIIIGLKTKIKLIPSNISNLPFKKVSVARLGIDFGINGTIKNEIDDVNVSIELNHPIEEYREIRELQKIIHSILSFLVYATREIHITFELKDSMNFILCDNHLGYDTYVS